MKRHKRSIAWEYIESIIIALAVALLVRTFIVQPFKIPTGSMRPTLIDGDRIFVNKFIYGARVPFTHLRLPAIRRPKRGDVIVFKYPENPRKDFIKRLIATEGEVVQIANGDIVINGVVIEELVILKSIYYYNRNRYGAEGLQVKVPDDSFYVLGDNSASSKDSRYWGFVPEKNLIGKASLIYWPINRIRLIR